jgi:hypothetical protein
MSIRDDATPFAARERMAGTRGRVCTGCTTATETGAPGGGSLRIALPFRGRRRAMCTVCTS